MPGIPINIDSRKDAFDFYMASASFRASCGDCVAFKAKLESCPIVEENDYKEFKWFAFEYINGMTDLGKILRNLIIYQKTKDELECWVFPIMRKVLELDYEQYFNGTICTIRYLEKYLDYYNIKPKQEWIDYMKRTGFHQTAIKLFESRLETIPQAPMPIIRIRASGDITSQMLQGVKLNKVYKKNPYVTLSMLQDIKLNKIHKKNPYVTPSMLSSVKLNSIEFKCPTKEIQQLFDMIQDNNIKLKLQKYITRKYCKN